MLIDLSDVSPIANELFRAFKAAGGNALLVGGSVRDALRGKVAKDFDVEVYGLSAAAIEEIFRARQIRYNAAGRSFGVFKLHEAPLDIALPRRESKRGAGHAAFAVEGDPFMPIAEAARRRDFTVNAIYYDPLADEIFDPCGGRKDLERKVLRHVSPAFAEDPLRVLRAMQFAARFRFDVAPETVALCKTIEPENLSRERIFAEWEKLLTKGEEPSRGLQFLRECGWVKYFPELEALIGCRQDPHWHPEGDVWNHTLKALDAFARERVASGDERADAEENLVVGLAVLCHDFGKPATTQRGKDGKIHAYGHDVAGVAPAKKFLRAMTENKRLIEEVLVLVETHMRPRALFTAKSGDAAVRRLAAKVGRLDRLLRVCKADALGSNFHESEDFSETENWLNARAAALAIRSSAPVPIILGRHVLSLGIPAGRSFGAILHDCFEAQLDGAFSDEAGGLEFLKKIVAEKYSGAEEKGQGKC